MALEGTIKDFGLPDIFQLIGLQRKTGILSLTNEKDEETVTVTFENGMVVMADSTGNRLEDRLGNVLVKQGKISRERLDEALGVQKQTLQRLGHILATGSAITQKDLKDALQVQVSQIVFRVFRWRDGGYQFTAADTVDWDRENFVPMSADFILMEGIRMVDEWPIIEKKIPSFDVVFRPVVDPSLIEVGTSGADDSGSGEIRRGAPAASGKIRLSPEEDRVFRKVDGVRTVQAIIDGTGAAEFEVCRTLFDFLNRNLIAQAGMGAADVHQRIGAGGAKLLAPGLRRGHPGGGAGPGRPRCATGRPLRGDRATVGGGPGAGHRRGRGHLVPADPARQGGPGLAGHLRGPAPDPGGAGRGRACRPQLPPRSRAPARSTTRRAPRAT